MIVYHVTTANRIKRYKNNGHIWPPVRAWKTIEAAERFSLSTGRMIILRLHFPNDAATLVGHRGEAVYIDRPYPVRDL